jgi:hypothetical protein
VTRQALADCQRAQQELTTQQHNAETAGQEAQTANEYRAYTLPDGTINVGTYYAP